MAIADAITDVFTKAGARGFLHVRNIDDDGEVGIDADEPVVTASVFKIGVMLEVARQATSGELSLTDRVKIPASRRVSGPTGVSVMRDDVELSVRDLAYLMMSVSDNTATDVLMEMIGPKRITKTIESLGLHDTALDEDCAAIIGGLAADLGLDLDKPGSSKSIAEMAPERIAQARAIQPAQTNRTTPREMTSLLSMIWKDEAGPADACAEVRRIMALQVWPHRLASGFDDGVVVAAKTGTLPGIRNEAGVVSFPDGRRFAVAVFTTAHSYRYQQPAIDAAIGTAARMAIESLRKETS